MTTWQRLLRPVTLSVSAILWCIAALAAGRAVAELRWAVPVEWVVSAHWSVVLACLLVGCASTPFLAFNGHAAWPKWRESRRPYIVAGLEVAFFMWVTGWAAVAVAGRLGAW